MHLSRVTLQPESYIRLKRILPELGQMLPADELPSGEWSVQVPTEALLLIAEAASVFGTETLYDTLGAMSDYLDENPDFERRLTKTAQLFAPTRH